MRTRGAGEPMSALTRTPMTYLATAGPHADPATALTWGLLWLSVFVTVVVGGLVLAGVLVRRARPGASPALAPEGGGTAWITIGLALTGLALAASLFWTLDVLAEVNSPRAAPALTVQVVGHQWWWEVHYLSKDPAQVFDTANEIHIPVGQPVLVEVTGADVIHSFWIPALAGKTDTIPGRMNLTWLQADKAGVYRGQCTEYCGAQHAHMAVFAIADSPARFTAWRAAQIAPAPAPATAQAKAGEVVFLARCAVCHTVRGAGVGGVAGPDLTHLMSRRTIAAGALPNNPGSLGGWVADPQAIKPEAKMPAANLSGPELQALLAYLETLT
jgi:cytochrome c oxidase subunit 2